MRNATMTAMVLALVLPLALPPAQAAARKAGVAAPDVSAQAQRRARRAPPRITVRPRREVEPQPGRDYRRDCVPVFEQRWIPEWGGLVLYASQRCRWVPVPPGTPPAW